MAVLNPVPNPLMPRLWCYGFALVQCDVRQTPDFNHWGLQRPRRLLTPQSHERWRHLLAGLPDHQGEDSDPVLSPSIAALSSLRRQHPRVPLILLQTPYDLPPPACRLRDLVGKIRFPGLCHQDDALQPLRRLPVAPAAPRVQLEACRRFGFPLLELAQAIAQNAPDCQVHASEDGLLQIQLHLLSPYTAAREQPWLARRQAFDNLLTQQWFKLPFPRLVVARNEARCAHLRGDLLRVFGLRHNPWALTHFKKDAPLPRQTCFIAEDHALRFADVRGLFLIHLDGTPRQWTYRAARTRPTGNPRWEETESVKAVSLVQADSRRLCLVHGARGWSLATQCRFARDLPVVDQQARLTHLAALFKWREKQALHSWTQRARAPTG
ncbi:hypothetical protein [Acanthopleuribacter pedis]|uniref:Uncharacterized protein n=1 Tax=Acanthopleuribacter pedis TaxID=442870 RepID=A0A8J7QKV1_9BACT|nr:hypothetical protein [Acanthopleuribacter pedis]MBO1320093.1 hypothetical protein [Acanthopleuribacter pedis]